MIMVSVVVCIVIISINFHLWHFSNLLLDIHNCNEIEIMNEEENDDLSLIAIQNS